MPFAASTPAGYGLRPVYTTGGAPYSGATETFDVASVGTLIAKGHVVTVSNAGVFSAAGNAALTALTGTVVGVCDGVEYVDANGKFVTATYCPASLTGLTKVKLRIITDPNVVYACIADAVTNILTAATRINIGLGARSYMSGIAASGTSTMSTAIGVLTSANVAATNTLPLVIVGVVSSSLDEGQQTPPPGLTFYPEVLVRINPNLHIATASAGI
jgi:hypothetical protein